MTESTKPEDMVTTIFQIIGCLAGFGMLICVFAFPSKISEVQGAIYIVWGILLLGINLGLLLRCHEPESEPELSAKDKRQLANEKQHVG